jgi:hypothetical protein
MSDLAYTEQKDYWTTSKYTSPACPTWQDGLAKGETLRASRIAPAQWHQFQEFLSHSLSFPIFLHSLSAYLTNFTENGAQPCSAATSRTNLYGGPVYINNNHRKSMAAFDRTLTLQHLCSQRLLQSDTYESSAMCNYYAEFFVRLKVLERDGTG